MSIESHLNKIRHRLGGASASLGVRVIGRALSFVSVLVLTRTLGVHGYGVYTYAVAWATLLTLPSTLGANRLLVRHIASYEATERRAESRALVSYAQRLNLIIAVGVSAILGVVAILCFDSTYLWAVVIALPLIPIQGATEVDQAALQGLHHPELSLAPTFVVAPCLLAVFILAGKMLGLSFVATSALVVAGCAAFGALLVARVLRRRYLRTDRGSSRNIVAAKRRIWWIDLRPLMLVALVTNASAQLEPIMLGWLGDPAEVGRFQVALRVAQIVSLVLMGINTAIAPRIAKAHALGDMTAVREEAVSGSRLSLLWSLPVAAVVMALQGWLFHLFAITGGNMALTLGILVMAELINAAVGSVSVLLTMTGRGGTAARALLVGLALDITLCLVLIPSLGEVGGAIASGTDLVAWNLILAWVVWKTMGFNPSALSRAGTLRRTPQV
ncbi:MAG TPA: oligosaccharide flippase family protein [Solirubrobacterales bacterium]|nr:oligosaccharide flippase family protein [Solirubrobacterales bacterium]